MDGMDGGGEEGEMHGVEGDGLNEDGLKDTRR